MGRQQPTSTGTRLLCFMSTAGTVTGSPAAPYRTGSIIRHEPGVEVQVPRLIRPVDQLRVDSELNQPLGRERPPGLVAVDVNADLAVPEAGCLPAECDRGQFLPALVELFLVAVDGLLVPDRLFEQAIDGNQE